MSSLRSIRWAKVVGVCLGALAACSTDDALTNGGPSGTTGGSAPSAGTGGTGGAAGSEVGGMGGDGDDPGGAGAGGSGGAAGATAAGEGGMPGGMGGAGDAGGPADPVSVVSAALPDATLNEDYRFAFEARGGTGDGYAFTIEGGSWPRGLALEADGTLSGTPLEGGDFALELIVTDSAGATTSATLRLHVRQSRWLVYWNSIFGLESIPRYMAIDLADGDFLRRDLTGTLPANQNGIDASAARFSPDGRFVVHSLFVYGSHQGNEWRLVDFDRLSNFDWNDPQKRDDARVVANHFDDEIVKMYGPEWSPDSTRLAAYSLLEDNDDLGPPYRFTWFEIDEVLANPNRAANLRRSREGTAASIVDWISTDLVVYGSQVLDDYDNYVTGPLVKAAWQGGEPGAPEVLVGSMGQTFGDGFYLQYLNRSTQTAVIARAGNPHCLPSIELYDFTSDEAVNLGETPLLPAPELERFAGVFDSTLKIVDAANQTLATLGPSDCSLVDWSDDGTMLVWVDPEAKQLHVARVARNGQAEALTGPAVTYEATVGRPQFSSDKRWIAFHADSQLLVARLDETGIYAATRISVELAAPSTDRVGAYQFSPNGRAIVYAAPGQIAGLDDLYFVDLSGEAPGPSRRISPDLSGFPTTDKLVIPTPETDYDEFMETRFPVWSVWTPDSSKVFFVVHDDSQQVGDALWVVDLLAAQPRAKQVDVAICDSVTCGGINVVLPQPLR